MIRYVLTDIEGTTTPITFVHDVLFPYSAERLGDYVRERAQDPAVRKCLDDTKATVRAEGGRAASDDEAIGQLLTWIKEDRKHPALKSLQGMIWRFGYESKAYTAQVYDDVKPALEGWKKRGLRLGVYSSGSVPAQKLLFAYTQHGDLTPLFSDYFDTAIGGKRNVASYRNIVSALGRPAGEILFLSDVVEELDAAKEAGLATAQLSRPGNKSPLAPERHPVAKDFTAVDALTQ